MRPQERIVASSKESKKGMLFRAVQVFSSTAVVIMLPLNRCP